MSVIGIDIGNENTYVAVARAGGIETIANEYSQRSTPTYVAFGEKTRDLGVSAKNKQITNLKNTIFGFKRLIGRRFCDPIIQHELGYLPYTVCELPTGETGVSVSYLNEDTIFTVQQVMAMMMTKLKEISESALRTKVQDCVISVPVYLTDVERRAMLDAAEIAGLNVLRLMNEPTAVALSYGFYKQDLTDDKPKNVVFVDLGNSVLQVTACAFTAGKLKVLASVWDRNLGGRDFDNVLVKYFVEDFKARYKLDVMSNKRALMRLIQECEKLKKQMSANPHELPLNIECFMNDKDVSGRMKRETFENLASGLLNSVENKMRQVLHQANLRPDDIESVQVVGGSTRLPAVKALVHKVFGREASTTLNQDEAIARGCALQCAMLSPTFKVKEFSITDIQPYPIKLVWKAGKNEDSEMEIFPKYHAVPFSKMLTFFRTEPFTLDAFYCGADNSYGDAKIGSFTVQKVTPNSEGESTKIKVKVRVNINGLFSICSASMLEKQTVTETEDQNNEVGEKKNAQNPATGKNNADDAMDAENTTNTTANGEVNSADTVNEEQQNKEENDKKDAGQKKSKSVLKSVDLPIQAVVPNLSRKELDDLIEKEGKMIMQDKMEKEKADAKNAVEEYVYETRGKLSEELEKFITEQDKEKFRQLLDDTENWLYDEGEDQAKSVYMNKLTELKKHGDPVITRMYEWQQRPVALNEFGRSLQLVSKALDAYNAKEEQYAHIEEEEMKKVQQIWQEKEQWLGQQLNILSKLKPHEVPPIYSSQIKQEKEAFENQVRPILSKPKPKVEPPPETPQSAAGDTNSQAAPEGDSEMPEAPADASQSNSQEQKHGQDEQMFSQSQSENMETN